ncbi:hypothetical protein YC2023_087038 [Brassica napus]
MGMVTKQLILNTNTKSITKVIYYTCRSLTCVVGEVTTHAMDERMLKDGMVFDVVHIESKLTTFLTYRAEVRTFIVKQEMRTVWPDWAQQGILPQSYMKN